MKIKLVILTALLFSLALTLQAQTADGYVSQGRAFLAATNLTAANSSFANAVALSPNHPAANVFYAATRLLVLPNQPAGSNFLNRLGVPLAGRDIYKWTALLPEDTNGVPLAPAGVNANEATAMLRTNIFPALVAAEANLAKVTATNFTLSLTSNETRTVSVTLDYGDILMLRAMLHAGEFFAYTSYACNLDAQLAAIRALYTNDELSIERVLMDYPNLLTFTTTNELGAAKLAFQNGADLYLQASQFIRSRSTNVTRLFNYDAGKAQDEEKFRLTIADLKNSLNGAVPLAVDTNYTVFFSAPFSGTHPLRSFLPDFRGNRFVLGTLPDPTFGGLIYGITRPDADAFLAEHLLSVPTIAPGSSAVGAQFQFPINVAQGRGYVVQISTNLLHWTDYAAFVSLGGQYTFTDPNAYGSPRRFYRIEDRTGNMPPPANDDFANRALIPGMNVPVTSYTDSAGLQTGEPDWSYPGHTVWWTWTASVSGDVAVVTTGGSNPYRVAVFTGSSMDGLMQVVGNGIGQVSFIAQAGVTYQIAVDILWQDGAVKLLITRPPVLTVTSAPDGAVFSAPANILVSGSALDPDGQIRRVTVRAWPSLNFESTNGSFSFWWTNVPGGYYNLDFTATDDAGAQAWATRWIRVAPPNDNFKNAIPISGAPLTVTGSNGGADKEPGEARHAGNDGGSSIWWSWTSPSTRFYTVSASLLTSWGEYGYPLLGIYTGTSVSNLTALASNTPSFYGDVAQVTFTATVGVTCKFAVDGQYGDSGDITLKVIPTQPPIVSIVSPTNGRVLVGPTNVTITANASDLDGSVSRVDFYLNSTWFGSVTHSPFSMVCSNVDVGSYSLTAKATDNMGVFAYSAPVNITVSIPPNTNAPSGMALIPAGSFLMGDTFNEAVGSWELPTHTVYVSAFSMDKYEVTKALWDEVRTWAVAHGYSFDNAGSGKAANHPVQKVNWYDVVKWCNARSEKEGRVPAYYTDAGQKSIYKTGQVSVQNDWVKWNAGYRLPTEAEWEKAARGGTSGHRFPWSNVNTITHSQANYYSDSSYSYDVSTSRGYHPNYQSGGGPYTSPVGSFPTGVNGYGLHDMAGNVWEWCWDWYGSYASGTQTDPRGPTSSASGSVRVLRGGGWDYYAIRCRVAYRDSLWPGYGDNDYVGFRSALPPGQ